MKNLFFILIFILGTSVIYPQTKYLIYFKDKGVKPSGILSKVSPEYIQALKLLSKRSIERRKKVMGNNFIRYEDIPITKSYITGLKKLKIKIDNKLRWFNAVSAYLNKKEYGKVKLLPFVKKMVPVKIITFKNNFIKRKAYDISLNNISKVTALNYGPSYTQLALSDIPVIQSLGINGKNVLIGMLDTGFDWEDQPAFKNLHIVSEYDFVQHDSITENQKNDAYDQDSHGTYTLSIIGGYDPGKLIGVAYGASFMLAKTENISSETHIEEDNYAAALQWMEAKGVDVTSSSLGYNIFDKGTYSYTYKDMNGETTIVTKACNLAFQRGVVVITAAGNEGATSWKHIIAPADGFNVIAVGAVDSSNHLAYFSSRGPTYDGRIKPDLVAMGVNVLGARAHTGGYEWADGTSSATPIAAGVAALLLQTYPYLKNTQVREILLETGGNASTPNNNIGYGLISAKRAMAFPNLQKVGTKYILNKIFFNRDGINPSTAKIHYKNLNSDFISSNLKFDGKFKYNFEIPTFTNGDSVFFYFTYSDSLGNQVREPSNNFYKFVYGSFDIFSVTEIKTHKIIPKEYLISQNYPNPFNPATTINYALPQSGKVTIIVFDLLGRKVMTVVNAYKSKGYYTKSIDMAGFASGVYFYRININDFSKTKKMILLR